MNLFVYRKNLFDEGEGSSSKKSKTSENEDSPEKGDDTQNVLDNDILNWIIQGNANIYLTFYKSNKIHSKMNVEIICFRPQKA